MRIFIIALMVILFIYNNSVASMEDLIQAINIGACKEKYEALSINAKKDDENAWYALGLFLSGEGKECRKDSDESIIMYKKAADRGHPEALYQLGSSYYFGINVEQNIPLAINYLVKAAEIGDINSLGHLGYYRLSQLRSLCRHICNIVLR